MRPVRAFLMILMPLILMTSCAFFILNILASETNYLNVVWVGLFMFGALGIIELLTRSNKNLISTKTLM
ncbi:MAG: hypothetical protein KAR05_10090, partial [Candidatus Omnitrophica bacterium]|nr:hypothetical protein [Candidatus Omnitrophota bacterium]